VTLVLLYPLQFGNIFRSSPKYIIRRSKAFVKDEFKLSAKAEKNEELQKHLSSYYWAKSILSQQEQLYITEYFMNGKYQDEVVGLLGYNGSDDRGFRRLKREAWYL